MITTPTFKKSVLREYFESIVIAVILALFVRTWVVQAFKIPTGSMENNLLIGDHLLVNKFIFGPPPPPIRRGLPPPAPPDRPRAASRPSDPPGGHRRLQVSRGAGPRLHQARDRPAWRDDRAAQQEDLRQRAAARGGLLRPLPDAAVERLPGSDVVRRARALRSGHRAGRQVFRHGRQPRQLAGQPLLGLP